MNKTNELLVIYWVWVWVISNSIANFEKVSLKNIKKCKIFGYGFECKFLKLKKNHQIHQKKFKLILKPVPKNFCS